MNPELAAYQNAIERAKDEIAQLRAELARTQQDAARWQAALDEASAAVEAERAARERLRRLVRVAVARGFIPQDLREEVER